MGTATFGVAPNAQDADSVVGAALDLGVNFFDTADTYGILPVFDRPGAPPAAEREPAEQIFGRALAGRRDDVIIASKSCEAVGPGVNDRGLSRRHIIQQVESSLRRLGTDYIDLYYAHNPDPDTPLEQTLSTYDDLVRQERLRGISGEPPNDLGRVRLACEESRGSGAAFSTCAASRPLPPRRVLPSPPPGPSPPATFLFRLAGQGPTSSVDQPFS